MVGEPALAVTGGVTGLDAGVVVPVPVESPDDRTHRRGAGPYTSPKTLFSANPRTAAKAKCNAVSAAVGDQETR